MGKAVGILTLCVLAGFGVGAATGCGGPGSTSTTTGAVGVTNSATIGATELSPQQKASIRAEAGIPAAPDPTTLAAYIADLEAIDPDIVHGKPTKAVSRGLNQCSSIRDTADRRKLIDLTNSRFTSPNHPNGHGTVTAEKILDIVHRRLCPTY